MLGFQVRGVKGNGVAGWAFWAGGLLASWAIRPRGRGVLPFCFSLVIVFYFLFSFISSFLFY